MCDPEFDFRAWLPRKETDRQKRQRVLEERLDTDNYQKYRMETIAEVYSVPLRKIHYDTLIRYCLPNVDQIRREIKRDYMHISTIHVLRLADSGEINVRSKVLGQKMPRNFYRTTKLSAWRVFRFHHITPPEHKYTRIGGHIVRNNNQEISFTEYKDMLDEEVHRVQYIESEVDPGIKLKDRGKFYMVKDYDKATTRRGSMSGEFSGTLGVAGYKPFDKEKASRRASLEVRRLSADANRHVSFSNLIKLSPGRKGAGASPSALLRPDVPSKSTLKPSSKSSLNNKSSKSSLNNLSSKSSLKQTPGTSSTRQSLSEPPGESAESRMSEHVPSEVAESVRSEAAAESARSEGVASEGAASEGVASEGVAFEGGALSETATSETTGTAPSTQTTTEDEGEE